MFRQYRPFWVSLLFIIELPLLTYTAGWTGPVDSTPNSTYPFISEKNIFSPERKEFPVPAVQKSNPSTRPQVVLYGITIAGEYQAASITSPGRPLRKGERETITLKIGEKIGGYRLAKVSPDRIMLEHNGDSFEVLLYDPKAPKKRTEVKTETKPVLMVTSTQPAPEPSSLLGAVPATPATAPTPAPVGKITPPAMVQKPQDLPQQQFVPSIPIPRPVPAPRSVSPLWQRKRGIPGYPPASSSKEGPEQATR